VCELYKEYSTTPLLPEKNAVSWLLEPEFLAF